MDYREKLEELKGYVVKGLIVGGLLGTIPAGMIAIGTWVTEGNIFITALGTLFMWVFGTLYFGGIPYGWHLISKWTGNRYIIGSPLIMLFALMFKVCFSMIGSFILPGEIIRTVIKIKMASGS